jgi:allantoicase
MAARTLIQEMKYASPQDMGRFLSVYKDQTDIPDWAKANIALASRENLVLMRSDENFAPKENMTRGDAAVIIKRMFDRIR